MNINFIRNLSDEILRQNQQLKTQIILAKQRLSDFEEQILNAASSIHAPINIGLDASGALRELIKTAKGLNEQKNLLQAELSASHSQVGSLKLQLSMLESQNQCRKQQTELCKRREQQLKEERKTMHVDLQREKSQLQKANEQLSRQLIQLKEQLRLEKLMLIESKRRQIEEIRQYHLKQLLQFRERSDKEVVQIEKQMQQQVSQKDKVIRNLQKAMQKLGNSTKMDDQQSEVLVKLFKSFQEYNQLSKTLQERSQEIFKFRQHVQQLQCGRIKLQSKLKEVTMNEMNLNSQIQRLNIMKRDLQNKLQVQTKLLSKSQEDKDIMEQYYDKKWNQQYKKVKLQLQKGFAEKIKAIEQENNRQLEQINTILQKSQQQLQHIKIRNTELQQIFKQYQQQRLLKQQQIAQRERIISRIYREKNEIQLMSFEEIQHIKLEAALSKITFQAQINSLNELLTAEKQLFDELNAKHRRQLNKTTAQFTIKIEKIIVQKQKQKKLSEMQLQKQVLKLKDQIIKKDNYLDNIKINLAKQIQADIVRKTEQAYRQSQIKSRQKQQQLTKKSDRWANRLKQVEGKYSHLRKKTEEDNENFRKEIMRLDAQNRIYQAASTKFQDDRKQFMIVKNEILIKIGDLEKKAVFLNGEIKKREEQKIQLEDILDEKNVQVTQLKEGRKIWLTQLISMQKSYNKQFDSLKKTHEKQINLLKSKIWQLQQICKKRPIKRKDYQKLQQMQKERKLLQNQIYLKQAENIILNQVKGYYENKFRQQQDVIHIEQPPKTGHAMTNFKLKLFKKNSHTSHKFSNTSNTQLEQSKQMVEMRKYIAKSAKKYPNLSLTKPKFQQLGRYHRFNTTHD